MPCGGIPAASTDDVDVVSDRLPADLWAGAAAVAAGQEEVRADWLSDAAKIGVLSPQVDADPALIYEGRNIRVYGERPVCDGHESSRRPADRSGKTCPAWWRKAGSGLSTRCWSG